MISVSGLHVRAGSFTLQGVDLEVPSGAYTVLMGKTGSGKTTLLESIAGLRPVLGGSIKLMGQDVTHLKPALRGVGYVPQDRALFSTMSVFEHLAFALRVRRWKDEPIRRRVHELADLLGIEHLLARRPAGLSGGEAQRVALGRALSFSPGILLLDEPLSALDDETRQEIHELLLSVRRHTAVTTLHITHNVDDARALADRVLRLSGGAIVEDGSTSNSRAAG